MMHILVSHKPARIPPTWYPVPHQDSKSQVADGTVTESKLKALLAHNFM
jgi:hypothetical protein